VAVENAFGDVSQRWQYIAYTKGLSSTNQPVGAFYKVAVLFTNILTYTIGIGLSAIRFVYRLPTVQQYLELDPED